MLKTMRSAAKYIWIFVAVLFILGFLLYQTSGLSGNTANARTPIASVNGEDITVTEWVRATEQHATQASQRLGRPLSLDERKQVDQEAFDELVSELLLRQELDRRAIRVTDAEVIDAARTSPPPEFMNAPQLQTDGRFDQAKYLRFLSSPMAKEQGVLAGLEAMYRTRIPQEKLFEQIAAGVYVTDGQLWSLWRDTHDTAQVTAVRLAPDSASEAGPPPTDAEMRGYYDHHHDELTRKGEASVSVVALRRIVTAADSAATLAHLMSLRHDIEGGAKFDDVAKRESADSASAVNGGSLEWGKRGRFVPQFETAAWALKPGEISGPVLTAYGYHLIKMDERKGDSALFRHILLRIVQSDSSAAHVNARADSLERLAAQSESPAQFDHAAKVMGLAPVVLHVTEGTAAFLNGRQVPSVSAWAFGGAKVGESSDLFESENGFYLARLDSLTPGGLPPFEAAKPQIERALARQRGVDHLATKAKELAIKAAASSLEQAAKADTLEAIKSPPFTRTSFVPELGQMTEAVGAAFALPIGAVSAPIKTDNAVFVMRVDRRIASDSAAWLKQKDTQRQTVLDTLRRTRFEQFLADLRQVAKVVDNRKLLEAVNRRAAT
ncbi:MAG: peptidylprolyl isomerase [Gemmatimonadales bacterium]